MKLNNAGKFFIDCLTARYMKGTFRTNERWDDSMQIQKTLSKTFISSIDLVKTKHERRVVEVSQLRKFICHNKGTHGRILRIMK